MPSSTSSSDALVALSSSAPATTVEHDDAHLRVPSRPVPGGRWGLPWLLALVVSALALVAFESFARARGVRTSIIDDEMQWVLERSRVGNDKARTLAILGASRIQVAWDPEAATARLPGWTIAQLAVSGSAPVSMLQSLAGDESFVGVALVDIAEWQIPKNTWKRGQGHVDAYEQRWLSPGALAERALSTEARSRLALLNAGGTRALHSLIRSGVWSTAPPVTTSSDRSQWVEYSQAEAEAVRKRRVRKIELPQKPVHVARWLRAAKALDASVDAIQKRGGRVVFVRMPSCDERWVADEKTWPKEKFWDAFASTTKANATIHFKDEPSLASFACWDTSHIESRDRAAFTSALIDVLADRGVLGRSQE